MTNKPIQNEDDVPAVVWQRLKLPKTGRGLFRPEGDTTAVAKVPGGWLLKFHHFHGGASGLTSQAVTFIPDVYQAWKPAEHRTQWETVTRRGTPNFNDWTDRLAVFGGWVYKTGLATAGRVLTLSLVFAADQPGEQTPHQSN